MVPLDPLRFPKCPYCGATHDSADPTDRCGVDLSSEKWIATLAIVSMVLFVISVVVEILMVK